METDLSNTVQIKRCFKIKVKAEKNSTDEFLSVYYLDEIEEVQKYER